MEYSSAIRKNEIFPFAAIWMDLENTILSESKQILHDIIYMWKLKNNTNKSKYEAETEL